MLTHPLADLFPRITGHDLQALAADVAENGLHHPVVLYDGLVLDGRNRLAACAIAKIEPRFEVFEGTEEEALALVLSLNLQRRHLTTAQRAALAVQLLPFEEDAARRRQGTRTDLHQNSDRSSNGNGQALDLAGKRVGISRDSVWRARRLSDDAPDVFAAMQDGVIRSLGEATRLAKLDKVRRTNVLEQMKAEGIRLKDADVEPTPVFYRSTGQVEWYTPGNVLDAARQVLGGTIDLDPASCAEANNTVKAASYYDIEADGLAQEWHAERLWLNGPYGTVGPRGGESRQGVWVKKLLDEHTAGRTKQAILLVRAAPCSAWFRPLWQFPLVFLAKRLEFVQGPGATGQSVAHSAVVGVGVDVERFVEVFSSWGHVIVPGSENGLSVSVQDEG